MRDISDAARFIAELLDMPDPPPEPHRITITANGGTVTVDIEVDATDREVWESAVGGCSHNRPDGITITTTRRTA